MYRPVPGFNEIDNYFVPAAIRAEFEQEREYPVRLRYVERVVECRCGWAAWRMTRDNEEFYCTCERCGGSIVFAQHCFHLFDVEKLVEPLTVMDAEVLDWEVESK